MTPTLPEPSPPPALEAPVSLVLPQAVSSSEAQAARTATPVIRDLCCFLCCFLFCFLAVLAGISRLLVEGVRADAWILIRPLWRRNTLRCQIFRFSRRSGPTTPLARLRRTQRREERRGRGS